MKLTFLGTSHGVPEPHRQCASTLVEVGGKYYIIDMGCMVIPELVNRGIRVDDVKGVFITHLHTDHMDGLFQFVELISWYYKTPDPVIALPELTIRDDIRSYLQHTGLTMKELPFVKIQSGVIFDDGILKVTAIPNQHRDLSYSFLLEAEGKRVLFTGDLKHPSVDFPKVEGCVDLAVCEGAHFLVTDYLPVWEGMDIGQIAIHHYVNRNVAHILKLQKELAPTPVHMVADGMEIRL